jgi:hypothetical protein
MTLDQAIALQPKWVGYWLDWLLFGAFVLPIALLIWRQSRIAAVATIVTSAAGAFGVQWLYSHLGYVKLLGLPHIVLWTPLAYYLFVQVRRGDMPPWPRRIMMVVLATIMISLAFDYADIVRYALGERTPLAKPA